MIVATAALCLTVNIFMEARGESIPGQYAVALVTLNRAQGDKRQVCNEVFKRRQFSWTNSGVKKHRTGWKIAYQMQEKDAHAWWLAGRIAETTLAGRMVDFTHGAKFYHTTAVRPVWRLAMVRTKKVGRHIFYSAA